MESNYNDEFNKLIRTLPLKRPKLLLHSCCGPCSSSVIEKVSKHFLVTIYYYNPNIHPRAEYEKRKKTQQKLCKTLNIDFLNSRYSPEEYYVTVAGHEQDHEGQRRCELCMYQRLLRTAIIAHENGFEYFGTTLSVSPYKNAAYINEIGKKIENATGIKFLVSDFKKENGYLRSIELSKKYKLYRQNYCGCVYSMTEEREIK
ncbi:MAG: epoxyqueuosine reductase QueH [Bacilli bacterium]